MLVIKNVKIFTMTGKENDIENGFIISKSGKIVELGSMENFTLEMLTKAGSGAGKVVEVIEAAEVVEGMGEAFETIRAGKAVGVVGATEVVEETEEDGSTEGVEVIDGAGCVVLPGLIDAHNHMGMWEDSTGFEGEDGNEMTDPVTPHLRAIDAIYHFDRSFRDARENGVTTVVSGPGSANVIGGQFTALKTYGRRIEDMLVKEPAAMKIAFGENPKTVYNEKKQMPMTRMATAALLREYLEKALEYLKREEDYKKNPEKKEMPDFDAKLKALGQVLKGEIPLKAHVHRADDILTAIRIAREFGLKITLDHCTEGHLIADIIAKEGLPALVGPMLTDRSKIELRNQTLKNPAILSGAGVKVAIMTDHPCVPVQHLCLCAALAAREGMDEYEALKAITINPAEIIGIDDRVGSLVPGKDADFALYNSHPLLLATKVLMTVINGEIVHKKE